MRFFAAIMFMFACSHVSEEQAATSAKKYTETLFAGQTIKGPLCMDYQVDHGILCSFTETEASGATKVHNLACDETSCIPKEVDAESYARYSGGSSDNDFLLWYMLFNTHQVHHGYSDWRTVTPTAYRYVYHPAYSVPKISKYTSKPLTSTRLFTAPSKFTSSRSTSPTRSSGIRSTTTSRSVGIVSRKR
jgi:hypothetical protein